MKRIVSIGLVIAGLIIGFAPTTTAQQPVSETILTNVRVLAGASGIVLVVATDEPTSLTDAYATIKVLATQQDRRQVGLLVNQASRVGEGKMPPERLVAYRKERVITSEVPTAPARGLFMDKVYFEPGSFRHPRPLRGRDQSGHAE